MRPQEFWGISSYLSTAIATFGGRYARELFWCYLWLSKPSWSFLYIKFSISCIFHKSITYGRTDRRTDGRTDQRTDTPSYRDASTHLIKRIFYCRKYQIRADGSKSRLMRRAALPRWFLHLPTTDWLIIAALSSPSLYGQCGLFIVYISRSPLFV